MPAGFESMTIADISTARRPPAPPPRAGALGPIALYRALRICIGMTFAMNEALLALAMIGRRFRLTLAEGARVMPFARMTLRPLNGLPMRIEIR
jgi:hypothetical protein